MYYVEGPPRGHGNLPVLVCLANQSALHANVALTQRTATPTNWAQAIAGAGV
jgi:hypothetical protein